VSGTLSADQRDGLQAQMDTLVDAQLALEKVKREVEAQPPVFRPHHATLKEKIDGAESYVNHVIDDWTGHAEELRGDAGLGSIIASLEHLQSFLGSAGDKEGLKQNVSEPIVDSALLIHSLRLRVSPTGVG
jgi:hypothetical protein